MNRTVALVFMNTASWGVGIRFVRDKRSSYYRYRWRVEAQLLCFFVALEWTRL